MIRSLELTRIAIAERPFEVNTLPRSVPQYVNKCVPRRGKPRALINRMAQHFAKPQKLGKFMTIMSASRIEEAMTRINTAMARIDAARAQEIAAKSETKPENGDSSGSARVLALVNAHEKLREEVADTIGELDALIEELEG